ncbi:prephenate dehydrogenase/arogenate dehydrogenase family protein [Streptomyces cahuitamycinicus]|uniref:Prephenate dehydrogenase nucleotide-binding domain-containing protein n=1 Tax=Streptomyces cahuitamycinicus TaxID=2070367 RepID=A0A2N8TWW0_9ACTN|nr:prephenate dehydrogenase/arogenate dehydrogenase family protein [Streptomyces cahuitamycinicus]PNG23507.1 hypothetical protein C1J00_03380 [Streptomyces cahuitamycinicus]
MTPSALNRVTVIGCGPVGTSIALALTRSGVSVALDDPDSRALAEARSRGAGTGLTQDLPAADLVVVAVPDSDLVDVLYAAQVSSLGRVYTDVAGSDERIRTEAMLRGCDLLGHVPGHPLAARLPSCAAEAHADLFAGRPWLLRPYAPLLAEALVAVRELVSLCGAYCRDGSAGMPQGRHHAMTARSPRRVAQCGPRSPVPEPVSPLCRLGQPHGWYGRVRGRR